MTTLMMRARIGACAELDSVSGMTTISPPSLILPPSRGKEMKKTKDEILKQVQDDNFTKPGLIKRGAE
jgi:hypothetical protein